MDEDSSGSRKSDSATSDAFVQECPECGLSYPAGSAICAECHTALVGIPKSAARKQPRQKKAHGGSSRSESNASERSKGRHPSILAKTLFANRARVGAKRAKHATDEVASSDAALESREIDGETGTGARVLFYSDEVESDEVEANDVKRKVLPEDEAVSTDGEDVSGDKGDSELLGRRRSDGARRAEPKRVGPAKKRFFIRRSSKRSGQRVILWEGKLSWSQRLRQQVPAPVLSRLQKVAGMLGPRVVVSIGIAVLALATVSVLMSTRPKPTRDSAQEIGLSFQLTDRWQDVKASSEWPGYFVVTSKILSWGAEPSLVFVKGNTALAILSREVETDTAPPDAALADAQDLALVYSLSTDTRLQGRKNVEYFGSDGVSFSAERWVSGEYYNEEVVVVPFRNRVVYLVYTAPQREWDTETKEIQTILESAEPLARYSP